MHTTLITCKNCGHEFTGNYCNNCGEKVYTDKDRHLAHFFEEGFHFFTHFEGKFFTTIKTLFTRPGQVSVDYTFGVRKKYFKLLSLFLLIVILYLLFPFFEGLNMKLRFHQQGVWGPYARAKVESIKHARNLSDAALEDIFHKKSEKISKTLLLVIIPLTALAFWAVTRRRRKYFYDQLVFATEISSMYLLWGFLLLPLIFVLAQFIHHLLAPGYLQVSEAFVGALIAFPMAVYTSTASRRFYGYNRWQSALFGLFYIVINVIVVQYLYKFILFVTVINTI